jgi:hypothetical protein
MEELGDQCHVVFAYFLTDTTCIGGPVCLGGGGGVVVLHSHLPIPNPISQLIQVWKSQRMKIHRLGCRFSIDF